MEADLQRYYRVDLADLFTGRLSLRRVGVLIAGLPPESMTLSAMALEVDPAVGGVPQQWSTGEHLLATVADLLMVLIVAVQQQGSKRRLPPPEPIQRPTGARKARPRLSEETKARMRRRLKGS